MFGVWGVVGITFPAHCVVLTSVADWERRVTPVQ